MKLRTHLKLQPYIFLKTECLFIQSDAQSDQLGYENCRDFPIINLRVKFRLTLLLELHLAIGAGCAQTISAGQPGIQQFSLHLLQGKLPVFNPLRIAAAIRAHRPENTLSTCQNYKVPENHGCQRIVPNGYISGAQCMAALVDGHFNTIEWTDDGCPQPVHPDIPM